MITLISDNLVVILVAVAIGIIAGWWAFRARAASGDATRTQAPPAAAPLAGEGKGIADEDAAAVADIVGEFLGVDVHAELPGASGPPDNLQTMKGVGAKLAAKLNELGVTRFDQLASLNTEQAAALDARLDQFSGRIARDRLVEQAGYLANGDLEAFQGKFGNLGS